MSVGLWLSRALRAFQVGESCESVEVETCDAQMDMHADLRRTVHRSQNEANTRQTQAARTTAGRTLDPLSPPRSNQNARRTAERAQGH